MKNKKTKLFVWVLVGLLLTTIAIQFRLSGSRNLNHFYDVGKKFIVSYQYYTISYEGLEYGKDGIYQVRSEDTSAAYLIDSERNRHWNYLYMDVSNIEGNPLVFILSSTNVKGDVTYETEVEIKEGMNEIPLGTERKSNAATIRIKDQNGSRFRIASMQFRERQSYFETGKVAAMLGIGMAAYLAVTGLFYWFFLRKKHFKPVLSIMDALTVVYGKMASCLERFGAGLCDKRAGLIRQIIFVTMIAVMMLTENYGRYNQWDYYKYFLLVNSILFFLIGLVSIKKMGRKVDWKNPLMFSWLVYSIFACVSDIIVPKTQMFTGPVMLIFFGVVFYIVSRIRRPVVILYDFMAAVKFTYIVTSLFCLICRPITQMAEGRYIGATLSPYSYALYLGVVISVFLAELDRCFLEKRSIFKILCYLTGLVSALYFTWITQSRDGVLAVGCCILLFLTRIFFMRKDMPYRNRAIVGFVLGIAISFPVLWFQDWAVHYLPDKLGTTVIFENDIRMIGSKAAEHGDETVGELDVPIAYDDTYAQETAQEEPSKTSHILKRAPSLDILSSGRLTIYKEYIANMNLWGHEKDPYIGGQKMRAHNAILQTGYRYGIFAMVPYTIMVMYVLHYAWIYMKKNWKVKKSYAMIPILLAVTCEVMMMLDNVERNFRYLPWLAFYLLIAILGNTEEIVYETII